MFESGYHKVLISDPEKIYDKMNLKQVVYKLTTLQHFFHEEWASVMCSRHSTFDQSQTQFYQILRQGYCFHTSRGLC